jgi:predicted RecB family nuclease
MRARPYDRAMRLVDELLRLSATDLANHLGCIHLSELNRAAAQGLVRRPRWDDPLGELLRARGHEHEKAYLAHLRATASRNVIEIPEGRDGDGRDLTTKAMRAGADVIYQAPLGDARWYGRADFLIKVPRPSELGSWSYEVTDAKLATETRAGTVLQLCVYSELVAAIQGLRPEHAHVVAPHHELKPEPYRLAEYEAYYRLVKRRLETALDARAAEKPPPGRHAIAIPTYPEPVQHCEVCSWWARCDAQRRADDHLCFVAGISKTQIKELERIDVDTLERLGELRDVPKPARGSREALVKSRDQAAIQLKARRLDAPQHEILAPLGPEHGFAKLPEPTARDLFLDLEGDKLAADGGREYLFGYVSERRGYVPLWAAKREFERVIDTILAEFRAEPGLHVYHFGAYEPAAMKRLSGRYATRETELDTILRAELFIDLHTIVRHSLRASVESYSIKELERFYGLDREQDLRAATLSRRAIEWAIEMHEELPIEAAHLLRDGTPANAPRPQLELALGADPEPTARTGARPAKMRERAIEDEPQEDTTERAQQLAEHVAAVERYNREDCVSARALRDWLEQLRAQAQRDHGVELPRPELSSGAASEQVAATAQETQRVMSDLLAGVPVDPEQRTKDQQARWLMAHLLEWHRREDKAAWWEFFRLRDLPLEDYEAERSALAGLTFVGTVGGTHTRPVQRYSFPTQDHDIRKGDCACLPFDMHDLGEVVSVDVAAHTIDIQHNGKYAAERPERVFVHRNVRPGTKPDVLLEIGRWIATHGVDAPGEHRAARDLLLRRPPRLVDGSAGLRRPDGAVALGRGAGGGVAPLRSTGGGAQVIAFGAARSAREQRIAARIGARDEDVDPEVLDARRLGFELDRGVLPIQGPPGTGKTFTGAQMILELVKAGKRIGVSAVSHEAIRTLLRVVCELAEKQELAGFKCLHRGNPKDENPDAIHAIESNSRVADLFLHGDYSLLGGTAWLWARPEFRDSVEVLFIDEAGQMSLADVLAVSAATRSLVLLGDPQQLEQPQQASHPPGTQASALEHLLGGAKTIPAERGLFLHQTRRLHPQICKFTAEAFYENRLTSAPGLERQALLAAPGSAAERFGETGLVYVPVEHEGNQARAQEEVDAVAAIAAALTSGDVAWRDRTGAEAPLTRADLMIVAPYNAQVTALSAALRDVRIGTVDKFQGQQAPVVIVSLTTSTPEDAPRGMDFLYSANRLNVATSRARGLCILVGNPRLFDPDCRTPQQMRLANAFCRYRELARVVQPPRTL